MQRTLVALTLPLLLMAGLSLAGEPDRSERGVNFAAGGATTGTISAVTLADPATAALLASVGFVPPSLSDQLGFALSSLDVSPSHDLFVLYAGENDIVFGTASPDEAVANIIAALEALHGQLGARQFLVFGARPVGEFPLFDAMGAPPEVKQALSAAAATQNDLLEAALEAFRMRNRDAIVAFVDTEAVYRTALADPSALFDKVSPRFCTEPNPIAFTLPTPPPQVVQGCVGFVFVDGIHSTGAAAGRIAAEANRVWRAASRGRSERDHRARVTRVHTLGDSSVDGGSLYFLATRANQILGNPTAGAPAPPTYANGRFVEGPNGRTLLQQLEEALGVPASDIFVQQPTPGSTP